MNCHFQFLSLIWASKTLCKIIENIRFFEVIIFPYLRKTGVGKLLTTAFFSCRSKYLAGSNLLKVNNGNTRKWVKLVTEVVLAFLMLSLDIFCTFFWCFLYSLWTSLYNIVKIANMCHISWKIHWCRIQDPCSFRKSKFENHTLEYMTTFFNKANLHFNCVDDIIWHSHLSFDTCQYNLNNIYLVLVFIDISILMVSIEHWKST